jgi:hypothetical protein
VRPFNATISVLRRRGFLVALLGVVALGGARSLPAQISIESLEMHIRLGPGQNLSQVIPIRSEADSAQQLLVTVLDWQRDSAGANQFARYDSLPSSCRDRLQVFPATMQIGARATEFVRVSYRPNGASDPGCWAIVFVEVVRPPAPPKDSGASVTFTIMTGVKVYVHPAAAVADGEVEFADVEQFYDFRRNAQGTVIDSVAARRVAVRFSNTGTAHLVVKTSIEVRNANTQLVREVKGPDAHITPNAFRDILVTLPELPRGRYIAVALLDFGGAEIRAAQVEFEVP